MGFIKTEAQPPHATGFIPGQSSTDQHNHFAFMPFGPPPMDGLHPQDLCKPGASDGRSKVARACTECKARKMRCDGGLPFCGRCINHNRTKSCAYVDPPKRSPITRQYVSSLESQLEEAKKKIANFETKAASEQKATTTENRSKNKPTTVKDEDAIVDATANVSTRARAVIVAGGDSAAVSTSSKSSKKRSRTASGSLEEAEPVAGSSFHFGEPVYSTTHMAHHFPAIRGAIALPKSLVEKAQDNIGVASFISLSSCTAVLKVAGQLSKTLKLAASGDLQSAPSIHADDLSKSFGRHKLKTSDDAHDLSCDALAKHTAPTTPHDPSALLPLDLNVSSWDAASKQMAVQLVDSYFNLHHPAYPILHASTFKSQLNSSMPKPEAGSWTMLVNMVFALGCFEQKASARDAESDLHYYDLARKCYDQAIFEKEDIVTVQALALMANYSQKRNYFSTSWMVLGSALRMAVSLGFHQEKPANPKRQTPLEKELGRRLWWMLYTMEADCCISLGRPNSLIGLNADVALPRNLDDANAIIASDEPLKEKKGATVYSTLIAHARFASEISMPVQARLIRSPNPTIEEIRTFDLRIQEFVDRIPSYMQEDELKTGPVWFTHAANRLRWRCNNLRMFMFRPFLLSAALSASVARQKGGARPTQRPAVKQAIALCRQLAKDNVNSIARYWESHEHNQAVSWHGVYFLLQSAFIPLVSLLDNPTSQSAGEWISVLNTCKALLEHMGQITPIGLTCRDTIQSLAASVLDDHASRTEMSLRSGWVPNSTAATDVDSIFWPQPYAASSTSDGTDMSDLTGPPTLAFSIGSANSGEGAAALEFRHQSMHGSPSEHRPSLGESIDAWAAVRPETASQWSDTGSHLSGNDARFMQSSRERQSSSTADNWTLNFDVTNTDQATDSLFTQFQSRSAAQQQQWQQQHAQPSGWWDRLPGFAPPDHPEEHYQHQRSQPSPQDDFFHPSQF